MRPIGENGHSLGSTDPDAIDGALEPACDDRRADDPHEIGVPPSDRTFANGVAQKGVEILGKQVQLPSSLLYALPIIDIVHRGKDLVDGRTRPQQRAAHLMSGPRESAVQVFVATLSQLDHVEVFEDYPKE